ncbi:MAG: VanW family protein [bacterium]|nr:VanW family protein [bacterium]
MPLSPSFSHSKSRFTLHVGAILALVAGLAVVSLFIRYHQRMLPNIYIDELPVGGRTALETRELLIAATQLPAEHTLTLSADAISISSSSAELGVQRLIDTELEQAFAVGRQGSLVERIGIFLQAFFKQQHFSTKLAYQPQQLTDLTSALASEVDILGTEPSARLRYSGTPQSLTIEPGSFGRKLNQAATRETIQRSLNQGIYEVTAVVASTAGELDKEQVAAAKERASTYIGKKITIQNEDQSVILHDQELIALLAFPEGVNQHLLTELLANWESSLYRNPQEPVLEYDKHSLAVTTFVAPQDGTKLSVGEARANLLAKMTAIESGDEEVAHKAHLPLQRTSPTKSLADTNTLGIKERIGLGTSAYAHSIPNRIWNVAQATKKLSLHIIPPGQEFSFNRALGDISARTGFRSAYVIKNGQTQLGDGGGVCQVSTTLFRAVLNAGLDITRRLPHSYRVSYYELDNKPGIDATVYSGDTDFRFINDTNHHILVYGEANSDNLTMKIELYGTSDGRTSEIVEHVTWNPRPPLPAQYIPTTAIAKGKLQQVDWSAPGISAKFTNIVKDKDGNELHKDTFTSVYRPWAAKFLQGV